MRIYDLICERLQALRAQLHVVRYEDMVLKPSLLAEALGTDAPLNAHLLDQPSRQVPAEERAIITAAFAAEGRHFRHFYPHL